MPYRIRSVAQSLSSTLGLILAVVTPTTIRAQEPAAKVAAPTKEQIASAEAFARQFESDLAEGRIEKVLGTFHREAILDAILEGLEGKADALADFREGLEKGLDSSLEQVTREWQDSAPKWKRILVVDGRIHARFRFAGPSGLSIIDLALVPDGASWRILDFDNRALGIRLVEQTRQTVAMMMGELGAGILARLFGDGGLSQADVKNMRAMSAARNRGDHAAALTAHGKLPKVVRDTALVTAMHVQCLAMGEDTTTYAAVLEDAAKRFPAPLFRFTLVDAHILKQEWAKAIACVDECMLAIERDAAILTLRAILQQHSGDLEGARKTLAEAMQLEPDCVYALVNGLDVLLAAKDWVAVRDAMKALEKTGKYDFRGNLDDELWSEFKKAPESEPWR
jgi:tetratricopeptide (TPR) repeat protein